MLFEAWYLLEVLPEIVDSSHTLIPSVRPTNKINKGLNGVLAEARTYDLALCVAVRAVALSRLKCSSRFRELSINMLEPSAECVMRTREEHKKQSFIYVEHPDEDVLVILFLRERFVIAASLRI